MPRPKLYTDEELRVRHIECVKNYTKANPEKHQKHALNYYYKNKDTINAKRRQKRAEAKQKKLEEAARK